MPIVANASNGASIIAATAANNGSTAAVTVSTSVSIAAATSSNAASTGAPTAQIEVAAPGFAPWRERDVRDEIRIAPKSGMMSVNVQANVFRPWS